MPSDSKFTKNSNGDTSVRVVSSAQDVADTDQDSVFCKDSSGNAAIRVVTAQESLPAEQPDSMFTKDTNGNTAIRTVGGGGGSAPVIDELNVTPSTSAQTITAPSGVDGYSPVNVAAVTSAIDANIVAGNIKKDVEILGVTGNYEGQTPTGTKSITANGVYDVTNYASADVQVPSPQYYIEKVNQNGQLVRSGNVIDLTGISSIGYYALYNAYSFNDSITTVDFSNIVEILDKYACGMAFGSCHYLTSVDLSSLTTIDGNYAVENMFNDCTRLSNINLSSLTTIKGRQAANCFIRMCKAITSINLSSLTTINGDSAASSMFAFNDALVNVDLSSLETIQGVTACNSMFTNCTALPTISFPALKEILPETTQSQFGNMFSNCNALTEIHFPSNMQTRVSQLTGYATKFGATNATIYFDLPATE